MFSTFSWSSVQFSHSVMSDSLQPHGLQHGLQASLPITSSWSLLKLVSIELVMPSNVSSSVIPFSSLQSFPASGSFPVSQFFTSGGQSIRTSALARVLPMNVQDWLVWSPCCPKDFPESSLAPQFESISSLVLNLLYGPFLTMIGQLFFFSFCFYQLWRV